MNVTNYFAFVSHNQPNVIISYILCDNKKKLSVNNERSRKKKQGRFDGNSFFFSSASTSLALPFHLNKLTTFGLKLMYFLLLNKTCKPCCLSTHTKRNASCEIGYLSLFVTSTWFTDIFLPFGVFTFWRTTQLFEISNYDRKATSLDKSLVGAIARLKNLFSNMKIRGKKMFISFFPILTFSLNKLIFNVSTPKRILMLLLSGLRLAFMSKSTPRLNTPRS